MPAEKAAEARSAVMSRNLARIARSDEINAKVRYYQYEPKTASPSPTIPDAHCSLGSLRGMDRCISGRSLLTRWDECRLACMSAQTTAFAVMVASPTVDSHEG